LVTVWVRVRIVPDSVIVRVIVFMEGEAGMFVSTIGLGTVPPGETKPVDGIELEMD
jgi:hypothetical protein